MPSQAGKNELKVCDAVIRCLESLNEKCRSHGFSPEDNQHEAPVEWVFCLGETKYALEHTIVEPFEQYLKSGNDFEKFTKPIVEKMAGKLPRIGTFTLAFEIATTHLVNRKNLQSLQNSIMDWVQDAASNLSAAKEDSRPDLLFAEDRANFIAGSVESGTVKLHLSISRDRFGPSEYSGNLYMGRFSPENGDSLRLDRISRAMTAKLPKLDKWKANEARTILILENSDMALSNHVVILQAAEKAMKRFGTVPDEIWLVSTVDTYWIVHCLMKSGQSLPYENSETRFWRFLPDELNSDLARLGN